MTAEVLIVGAGLAGLCCARRLQEAGVQCKLFEASDGVGGRIRTDSVDGFLLDRGFQVFLTAYPEAQRVLDYSALDLRPFASGALIRYEGRFHQLADPWRRPWSAVQSLANPIGTLADKLRIARLRTRVLAGTLEDQMAVPETTTLGALQQQGFSESMIERFWRPFFGGVFLERELQTSNRMFNFVFRMMSSGPSSLPSQGMQAIPRQIADALPQDWISLNSPVREVDAGEVLLDGGERANGVATVVATDGPCAARLLQHSQSVSGTCVACLYFAAPVPPYRSSMIVLSGDGAGPINNLCVPTSVSKSYGPADQSLVSVTVLEPHASSSALLDDVVAQLKSWYGAHVASWRHLKTYQIRHALPSQRPPALQQTERDVRVRPGLYVCGDHRDTASIQGAMVSGRRAAEAVLADRREA